MIAALANKCNVLGKIEGDLAALKDVRDEDPILGAAIT